MFQRILWINKIDEKVRKFSSEDEKLQLCNLEEEQKEEVNVQCNLEEEQKEEDA